MLAIKILLNHYLYILPLDFYIHFIYNRYKKIKTTNIEKVKELIEANNGILEASCLKQFNLHNQYLKILVDNRYLEKADTGLYVKKGKSISEFYVVQRKYKSSIFSHTTALYIYNLTDRTPQKFDLTFNNNCRINNSLISPHYLNQSVLNIGKSEYILTDGNKISIYNIEKTIIDIIRDRKKIDKQVFNTALKSYTKMNDKDLNKLITYARLFNVEKILQYYMEILL